MSNQKRLAWIDILRGFAIVMVVLCHSTEGIYKLNYGFMSNVDIFSKVFAFTAFTAGRLGVPFFLFITGYLLLDRKYDTLDCKKFWKKNWLGLLITTEIWIVIYNLFLCLYNNEDFVFSRLIKEMLFFKNVNISHIWYMTVILGMYIFVPIVANALQNIDLKMLKFPLVFVLVYIFLAPIIDIMAKIILNNGIIVAVSTGFSGGSYGVYLVLGYLVKKGAFKKLSSKILFIVSVFAFALTVGFQLFAYSQKCAYNVWYDCGFLLVCTVCAFELLSRKKDISCNKAFFCLSKYSFAIYLIHNPIIMLIKPYVENIGYMPLEVITLWIASVLLSLIIAALINRIPKAGRTLLYMR